MKKSFKNISLSIATIFGLYTSPVSAQRVNPVGMRYVGSQQYMGQNTQIVNPNQQRTLYVAPQINSVYAKPMNRVSEIPLYGKNKSTYFYGQKKKDDGLFSDNGLYMFAAYSTGKTTGGINLEHGEVNSGEADANDSMGTASGLTLGVGRVMSNTLSVEFMYSKYNKMKFGDWVKFNSTEEQEKLDENGDPIEDDKGNIETEETSVIDDSTYEVTEGGQIDSNFIGLGFKYNLENLFGTILGRLKPYIGFQIGIAQNTIKDYIVNDDEGYTDGDEIPEADDDEALGELKPLDIYTAEEYSNGELNFIGATTRSFAVGAELGFSIELEGNLSIDIFYKINNYGKVKTSGTVLSTYDVDTTEFYIVDNEEVLDTNTDPGENPCGDGFNGTYDPDAAYTLCTSDAETEEGIQTLTERRVSSGDMNFRQYGIKLKYMF